MRYLLALLFLSFATVSAAQKGAPAFSNTGQALTIECKAWVGDARSSDGRACFNYIQGYTDNANPEYFCLDNIRITSVIYAYLAYMDQHTNWLSAHKTVGLDLALTANFRCPTGKPADTPAAPSSHSPPAP
ncbi:MAG: Rap1a/Tai family immunity protein [Janthinobacterium lividum]